MTDKNYTLLSSPPNRKEFAEAFGQNQAAVRRLENLTLDVTKNRIRDQGRENAKRLLSRMDSAAMLVRNIDHTSHQARAAIL